MLILSRVFYINLPFCAVGLVSVPIWLRYEKRGPTNYATAVSTRAQQTCSSFVRDGGAASAEVTLSDRRSVVSLGGSTLHDDSMAAQDVTRVDQFSEADREGTTPREDTSFDKVTMVARFSSVDWTGSMLMVVCSTSFLVGLSWGGNQYRWYSPAVLVPIIAGMAGIVLTVFYEKRFARNPFLRLTIFQHWSGIVISICTIVQGYLVSADKYNASRATLLTKCSRCSP